MRWRRLWLFSVLWTLSIPPGASGEEKPVIRFEFTRPLMGTTFRIVLFARTDALAETAAETAFARIAELNAALSDYDPKSELSQLSERAVVAGGVTVSEDLWTVLVAAQTFARQTEGAFDVTVGPLMRLWRVSRRTGRLPEPEDLRQTLERTGYRKLVLHADEGVTERGPSRRVELAVPGMKLDLGGIAKGFAVDEALKCLRDKGIRSALVDGGGDLRVFGRVADPDGQLVAPWKIRVLGLRGEAGRSRPLEPGRAVASSGDLFKSIEINGRRFSHLLDPQTGLGLEYRRSVSVEADDCMTADALASALSVLPVAESRVLLKNHYPTATAVIETENERGGHDTVVLGNHTEAP